MMEGPSVSDRESPGKSSTAPGDERSHTDWEEAVRTQARSWAGLQTSDVSKSHVDSSIDLVHRLMAANKLEAFAKFLELLDEVQMNCLKKQESFNRALIQLRFSQGNFQDAIRIMERESFSDPGSLLWLWDQAHYKKQERSSGRSLDAVARFRVRRKHPPPPTLCPGGQRPGRMLGQGARRQLQAWLEAHRDDPYPSRQDKERLSRETGLSCYQIKTWFANSRRRLHQEQRQRLEQLQEQRDHHHHHQQQQEQEQEQEQQSPTAPSQPSTSQDPGSSEESRQPEEPQSKALGEKEELTPQFEVISPGKEEKPAQSPPRTHNSLYELSRLCDRICAHIPYQGPDLKSNSGTSSTQLPATEVHSRTVATSSQALPKEVTIVFDLTSPDTDITSVSPEAQQCRKPGDIHVSQTRPQYVLSRPSSVPSSQPPSFPGTNYSQISNVGSSRLGSSTHYRNATRSVRPDYPVRPSPVYQQPPHQSSVAYPPPSSSRMQAPGPYPGTTQSCAQYQACLAAMLGVVEEEETTTTTWPGRFNVQSSNMTAMLSPSSQQSQALPPLPPLLVANPLPPLQDMLQQSTPPAAAARPALQPRTFQQQYSAQLPSPQRAPALQHQRVAPSILGEPRPNPQGLYHTLPSAPHTSTPCTYNYTSYPYNYTPYTSTYAPYTSTPCTYTSNTYTYTPYTPAPYTYIPYTSAPYTNASTLYKPYKYAYPSPSAPYTHISTSCTHTSTCAFTPYTHTSTPYTHTSPPYTHTSTPRTLTPQSLATTTTQSLSAILRSLTSSLPSLAPGPRKLTSTSTSTPCTSIAPRSLTTAPRPLTSDLQTLTSTPHALTAPYAFRSALYTLRSAVYDLTPTSSQVSTTPNAVTSTPHVLTPAPYTPNTPTFAPLPAFPSSGHCLQTLSALASSLGQQAAELAQGLAGVTATRPSLLHPRVIARPFPGSAVVEGMGRFPEPKSSEGGARRQRNRQTQHQQVSQKRRRQPSLEHPCPKRRGEDSGQPRPVHVCNTARCRKRAATSSVLKPNMALEAGDQGLPAKKSRPSTAASPALLEVLGMGEVTGNTTRPSVIVSLASSDAMTRPENAKSIMKQSSSSTFGGFLTTSTSSCFTAPSTGGDFTSTSTGKGSTSNNSTSGSSASDGSTNSSTNDGSTGNTTNENSISGGSTSNTSSGDGSTDDGSPSNASTNSGSTSGGSTSTPSSGSTHSSLTGSGSTGIGTPGTPLENSSSTGNFPAAPQSEQSNVYISSRVAGQNPKHRMALEPSNLILNLEVHETSTDNLPSLANPVPVSSGYNEASIVSSVRVTNQGASERQGGPAEGQPQSNVVSTLTVRMGADGTKIDLSPVATACHGEAEVGPSDSPPNTENGNFLLKIDFTKPVCVLGKVMQLIDSVPLALLQNSSVYSSSSISSACIASSTERTTTGGKAPLPSSGSAGSGIPASTPRPSVGATQSSRGLPGGAILSSGARGTCSQLLYHYSTSDSARSRICSTSSSDGSSCSATSWGSNSLNLSSDTNQSSPASEQHATSQADMSTSSTASLLAICPIRPVETTSMDSSMQPLDLSISAVTTRSKSNFEKDQDVDRMTLGKNTSAARQDDKFTGMQKSNASRISSVVSSSHLDRPALQTLLSTTHPAQQLPAHFRPPLPLQTDSQARLSLVKKASMGNKNSSDIACTSVPQRQTTTDQDFDGNLTTPGKSGENSASPRGPPSATASAEVSTASASGQTRPHADIPPLASRSILGKRGAARSSQPVEENLGQTETICFKRCKHCYPGKGDGEPADLSLRWRPEATGRGRGTWSRGGGSSNISTGPAQEEKEEEEAKATTVLPSSGSPQGNTSAVAGDGTSGPDKDARGLEDARKEVAQALLDMSKAKLP